MSTVQHKFAIPYPDLASFVQDFTGKIEGSGLSLKSAKLVVVGQRTGLHIRFQDGTPELYAMGDIAWVDSNTDPATGKVSFLIKNIRLDDESRARVTRFVQSGGTRTVEDVEETIPSHHAVRAPAGTMAPPQPVAPAAHFSDHGQSPEPVAVKPAAKKAPGNVGKKKKIIIAVAIVFFVFGSTLGWIFGLGGLAFIFSHFVNAPPPPLGPPAQTRSMVGVEMELPGYRHAPKAKPQPIPAARLNDMDPILGSTFNKFILYFDRRPRSIEGQIYSDPPRYELVFNHTRAETEKPQYFLPAAFAFVRTLQFDQNGDDVTAIFLAKQAYVPRVVYEWDGNELTVLFMASD